MGLRISGKNLDIGEALRGYVQEKIDLLAQRHGEKSILGHIVLTKEGAGYRCDCMLILAGGTNISADGRAHDPHASFDQALERIEKRLRRFKNRQVSRRQRVENMPIQTVAEQVFESPDEELDDQAYSPMVIAETHAQVKTSTVADAVLELDITGAAVVVFRHAGNGHINLVYRRRDGNIGWIDPKSDKA